jgi:TPR repeat protein
MRVLGCMYGMRVYKQCDWNKAERLLLEAKQTPEVTGLQGWLVRQRAGFKAPGVAFSPTLRAEAVRLWETAAKLGDWWSQFGLLYDAFQAAPENSPEELLADRALVSFVGMGADPTSCKLYRPDCAFSVYFVEALFAEGRVRPAAARLGMARNVDSAHMEQLRFPPYIGRDAEGTEDASAVRERMQAAMDAGLVSSFSNFGFWLDQRGEGDKAHAVYERGAQAGCPISGFNAALNFYRGKLVPEDTPRAFALWSQAADLGDAQSMYDCGDLLATGAGVPKDLFAARKFFQRAAAAGWGSAGARVQQVDAEIADRQQL